MLTTAPQKKKRKRVKCGNLFRTTVAKAGVLTQNVSCVSEHQVKTELRDCSHPRDRQLSSRPRFNLLLTYNLASSLFSIRFTTKRCRVRPQQAIALFFFPLFLFFEWQFRLQKWRTSFLENARSQPAIKHTVCQKKKKKVGSGWVRVGLTLKKQSGSDRVRVGVHEP